MSHPNGQDIELDLDEHSSLPDSPLIVPTQAQPKWFRNPRRQWWQRVTAWLADTLRPRRSWKYILCLAVALYAIVCLARGSPLLASPLPGYTGRYDVGAIDLEIPLEKPRVISDAVFRGTGEPAFKHQTTLFTVYYPVAKGTKETKARHPWLARPISLTAEGYAKYAHMNSFITRPIFTFALWAVAGSIEIPAKVDAPLLETKTEQHFPVMVFSHGDASSRTDYTNYLGELASRGYIVAAIEHRDGSCPGSLMKIKGEQDKTIVHFSESELRSDPRMDTATYKKEQLAFRDAEILETIKILRAINDGQGADIFSLNSRSEGSSLHAWANRLALNKLVIAGHSFGATGALQALKSAPAVGGIILDPGKSSGPLNANISAPLLLVHSTSWSQAHTIFYGRPHFDTVKDLALTALNRTHASWFLTSLGTSHPSVSDAPLIEPLLLSWTTGASSNTKEALKEYVRISADFWDFLLKGQMNSVLAEAVTHEEYGKWVSEKRKKEFPKDLAKYWEVHVSPASEKQ